MSNQDKILSFIQRTGPIVPAQINKYLNTDLLFASAMLAELSDSNKLKLSKLKIGGSPLYFIPGQESQLSKFSNKLSEKDKKTYDFLQKEKVLDESGVDPLVRVSLQNIPDFAVRLELDHKGKRRYFWKFFNIDQKEVEDLIKNKLGIAKENKFNEKEEKLSDNLREQIKKQLVEEIENEKRVSEEKNLKDEIDKVKPIKSKIGSVKENKFNELVKVNRSISNKDGSEIKKEGYKLKKEKCNTSFQNESTSIKNKLKIDSLEEQTTLSEEQLEEPLDDEFYQLIKSYFICNKIDILSSKIIRKNSDLDLVIDLPTAVGKIKYYCKAKAKKKVNGGDLSSAYISAQMKKMPILFLTTGEITKKARDLASKEFTTMVIKQI